MLSVLSTLVVVGAMGAGPLAQPSGDVDAAASCAAMKKLVYAADPEAARPRGATLFNDTDVLHHNLDIEIIPSTTTITGSNTMTIKALADNLTVFDFRLRSNFTISSVTCNGVSVPFNRIDTVSVEAVLDRAYNTDEVFDLKISYTGVPVSRGFGSIDFSTQGGQPLVSTLSESTYAYTWWPEKDDNRDKATADLAFTVPNGVSVPSNGVLQGVDSLSGNRSRWRWKTDYQTATYLLCFSLTNYNHFSDTFVYPGGTMPMEFYIFPANDTTANRNAWLLSKTVLGVYSNLFGLYPFVNEKYGMYQFTFSGGMEHQTMTGMGTFSESVVAHELGHQWWGDMVTCAAFNDIWLNEGFATYCEALWAENKPGSTGEPALLAAMAARKPSTTNGTVYVTDATDINRVFSTDFSYDKGGWVLHMLRHVLGDQQFFAALAAYRSQHLYNSAFTDDFRTSVESVYGSDLTWFFNQWVFQVGAPAYQYAWRQVSAAGQNWVEVYIKQNQNAAWPTFKMPIDIATTAIAVTTTHVVWNDARTEHLLFSTPALITSLAFDPKDYILDSVAPASVAFVEGPPKIVAVAPAPGSSTPRTGVSNISVVFHIPVTASAAQFSLVGASVGTVPLTYAYNAAGRTAVLTPSSTLAPDTYTLTVSAGVLSAASSLALDGEIADPLSPASFPSGNGLPGGAGVVTFTITGTLGVADFNADGAVNALDLAILLGSWGPCPSCPADLDGDGQVGALDLALLLGTWG